MTQRNAILTAAVLTSFVLVLIGGVVARVTQASAAAEPGSERLPYRPAPNHPWRRSPIGRARFQPAGVVSQPKL